MKLWKLVLGISLVVNVLFLLREIRENGMFADAVDQADKGLAKLDRMQANVEQLNQDLRDQHLSMAASNDQLGAYIEEHVKNVG
ncbi:MAG: hypothetical protein ABI947_19700 [Chloroflexota bacterium]